MLLNDSDRAILQRRIADLIRSANPAERAFRASRVKVLALSNGRQSIADETLLASIAAVCFDDALWDACAQVRQAVALDDARAAAPTSTTVHCSCPTLGCAKHGRATP